LREAFPAIEFRRSSEFAEVKMDLKILVLIIVGVLVFSVVARVIGALLRPRKFSCAECGRESHHTARTRTALREGRPLFCGRCHAQWLKEQPRPEPRERGGCGCVLMLLCCLAAAAVVAAKLLV
jgi:hypothetical protein